MSQRIEVVEVDREDGDYVIVSFSDGTCAKYTVDELLALRPHREPEPES
jgi:hypothetical protein